MFNLVSWFFLYRMEYRKRMSKWTNGYSFHSSHKAWIVLYFCLFFLPCSLSHWKWAGFFFGQIIFWQYPNGGKSKLINNHWFAANTFIIYVITFIINIFIFFILFQLPDMFPCFSLFQRQMGHMGLSRRAWHGRKMNIDGFARFKLAMHFIWQNICLESICTKIKIFPQTQKSLGAHLLDKKDHATQTIHGS